MDFGNLVFENMTVKELRAECKRLKLKNCSRKVKEELIDILNSYRHPKLEDETDEELQSVPKLEKDDSPVKNPTFEEDLKIENPEVVEEDKKKKKKKKDKKEKKKKKDKKSKVSVEAPKEEPVKEEEPLKQEQPVMEAPKEEPVKEEEPQQEKDELMLELFGEEPSVNTDEPPLPENLDADTFGFEDMIPEKVQEEEKAEVEEVKETPKEEPKKKEKKEKKEKKKSKKEQQDLFDAEVNKRVHEIWAREDAERKERGVTDIKSINTLQLIKELADRGYMVVAKQLTTEQREKLKVALPEDYDLI